MAELGHPLKGDQSVWTLTPGEIRIYAEGMKVRNDRKRDAANTSGTSTPRYNRRAKEKRDNQALQSVSQKVKAN